MKKIKHSKIKNTGILFELLVRQVTADVLNDGKKSVAVKLLKKYFSNTKPLGKEITLYNSLMKETSQLLLVDGSLTELTLKQMV